MLPLWYIYLAWQEFRKSYQADQKTSGKKINVGEKQDIVITNSVGEHTEIVNKDKIHYDVLEQGDQLLNSHGKNWKESEQELVVKGELGQINSNNSLLLPNITENKADDIKSAFLSKTAGTTTYSSTPSPTLAIAAQLNQPEKENTIENIIPTENLCYFADCVPEETIIIEEVKDEKETDVDKEISVIRKELSNTDTLINIYLKKYESRIKRNVSKSCLATLSSENTNENYANCCNFDLRPKSA